MLGSFIRFNRRMLLFWSSKLNFAFIGMIYRSNTALFEYMNGEHPLKPWTYYKTRVFYRVLSFISYKGVFYYVLKKIVFLHVHNNILQVRTVLLSERTEEHSLIKALKNTYIREKCLYNRRVKKPSTIRAKAKGGGGE